MDDIIIHGLNVNQDRFQEMLPQTTNYRKSVVFVDGEYFYL
ncbi:hypothetical protein EZS27_018043 [termite gut metagenome]|uniref:Uncharacterized protein n=1 Tax=termite gut metagenome TaxID=433724 RepID=A0A5J4RHC8_9ZZZZ